MFAMFYRQIVVEISNRSQVPKAPTEQPGAADGHFLYNKRFLVVQKCVCDAAVVNPFCAVFLCFSMFFLFCWDKHA